MAKTWLNLAVIAGVTGIVAGCSSAVATFFVFRRLALRGKTHAVTRSLELAPQTAPPSSAFCAEEVVSTNTPLESSIEPLTAERLRARSMTSFPAVYGTTISVIQGVGLSILTTNLFNYLTKYPDLAHALYIAPYFIASFSTLIIVSLCYMWLISIYRWSPMALDSIILFLFGTAQLMPFFYLGTAPAWWWLTAAFAGVGVISFGYTLSHCIVHPGMFGSNVCARKFAIKSLLVDIWIIIYYILILVIGALTVDISTPSMFVWTFLEVAMLIAFIVLSLLFLWKEHKFVIDFYRLYGMACAYSLFRNSGSS